ncbi:MAG: beta-lactamase family protein [Hyphomonadaceae bacterium]|nr:beta-lactamase family protein [Hyphomonadaceae bacterium]
MRTAQACLSAELVRMCQRRATVGIQYAARFGDDNPIEGVAGSADVADRAPVGPGSVFLSCSCTKLLTSILILQFVDGGALRLDDSHRRFVPESPYPAEITIEMLLAHSAGVPNPMPLRWIHTQAQDAHFSEAEALAAALRRHPRLSSAPGARVGYSNLGYWLLGTCLERTSGRGFAALLQTNIVARLKLDAAALSCAFPNVTRAVRGHFPRWGVATALARTAASPEIWDGGDRDWLRLAPLTMNGAAFGGAFATASGYLAVLRDLLEPNPALLSTAIRRKLFEPYRDKRGRLWPVTLGFRIGEQDGERYFSKPGGGPGFSGDVRLFPGKRLATAWLRNVYAFSEAAIWAVSRRLDAAILRSADLSRKPGTAKDRKRRP